MRRKEIEHALSDLRMDVDVLYKREDNKRRLREARSLAVASCCPHTRQYYKGVVEDLEGKGY
jgi:citrate lyase beta subunit